MATLAVILLHTCNALTNNAYDYEFIGNQYYVMINVVSLMNWSVPIFFMISGALLIKEHEEITYDRVIKKYCRRILLALVIFGIPFSMMEIFMNMRHFSFLMFPQACLNVLTGNSWGHLWYLYTLIGLYLILPVINAFFNRASRRTCNIFLILLFIFCFLIPVINTLFDIRIAFEMPIESYALFYFFVGKLLYTSNNQILNMKQIWGLCLVFLVLMLFVICFYTDGNKYLSYNSPVIAGISVCIFLLLRGIKINVSEYMWKIDRLCFGVYLIHPVFVNFLYKFLKVTPLDFGNAYFIGVILFWIGFIAVSFLASYMMNLVKPLKKYIL